MPYLFVPLILLVVAALVWSWWTARSDRDPASSVHHFNRALSAMQPRSAATGRPEATVASDDAAGESSRDA